MTLSSSCPIGMKTKIILDIKWLQEKRKTRPGKMIQTAEFLYLVAGRCSAGDNSNESSPA